jgi:hypothetical protein
VTLDEAVEIVEGVDAPMEQRIEAWQYLHETGMAYQLQGWYGRTAQHMLAEGLIV